MQHGFATLSIAMALAISPATGFSGPWMQENSGDTPYLNRAQDISLVSGGKVVTAGYLGDNSRSWDWFVEMFDREGGQSLWNDRVNVGSDRAHAVASTRLEDGNTLAVAVGRIGGKFAVRAYKPDTGDLIWEDRLLDIGDAYRVDAGSGRVNVTGTAVKFDQFLERQALQIVTRSYDSATGTLLWERRVVEGDAVRVTETDAIDTGMSRNWYSMVAWIREANWSGTMLRVMDNDNGRVVFLHRFPSNITVNSVVQRGKIAVVAGEQDVGPGKVGRVWAFDVKKGRQLWAWEPSVAKRVDMESSSVERILVKRDKIYVAVNRWIETQCQNGPCRFGERRGTVRSGLLRTGDLHWEVATGCAIRDLAAKGPHIVVGGVNAAFDLANPVMCGNQLDREAGAVLSKYEGLKGEIFSISATRTRAFVAGESHEPFPSVVNYFVGTLDNVPSKNP